MEEEINKLVELIAHLKTRIERADHKPGQWFENRSERGSITSINSNSETLAPSGIFEVLKNFGQPTGKFAEGFDLSDLRLAVAAVNALPTLLELATDGLKFRYPEKPIETLLLEVRK